MRFSAFLFAIAACLSSQSEAFMVGGPSNVPVAHRQPKASYKQSLVRRQYSDVALEDERQLLKSRLPPVNFQRMSKYEAEFRELLEGILYTSSDIEAVADPRMRAVMEGISASYYEPAVYRAFEVLYEDHMPLRVAGRLVYRRLRDAMENSRVYKQSQLEAVVDATGMSFSEAESSWSTFVRLGDNKQLSLQRLKTFMGESTLKFLGVESVHEAVDKLELNRDDDISFDRLMIALVQHEENVAASPGRQSSANLLQQVLDSDRVFLAESSDFASQLDSKHQKYNQRYDDMLEQFAKWKALIPDGEGRRLDILRGCFVGSENPAVVLALRVIYVDNTALRLSGDWIFRLVASIMNRKNT
ncbi:MAG: hypothetical protein SGILL_006854 [Bacillariaceae sp.]